MNSRQLIANRFEIQDLLGRGGMGEVYRAIDTQTGETVAVKALNAEILEREPELLARGLQDQRLTSRGLPPPQTAEGLPFL